LKQPKEIFSQAVDSKMESAAFCFYLNTKNKHSFYSFATLQKESVGLLEL
jgi:hypothetical protein